MAEVTATSSSSQTPKARLHLLDLPLETLRQILFEALMCGIEARQPYPLGRKSLPFDRHLHPVFSREELATLEQRVWGCPSFWGKETMTRLMRVNKQFYEEVYKILWSDFALHTAGLLENDESVILDWLDTYNPRAFDSVRHVHIRWEVLVTSPMPDWDYYRDNIMAYIKSFPGLLSVRFQISLQKSFSSEENDMDELKPLAVERILTLVGLLGNLDVKISWEPHPRWPDGKEIIDQCLEKLGQGQKLPLLHQQHLQSWPTEVMYINPAFKDVEVVCPRPSPEEMRSFFTRDWALKHWPKADRLKP
ncbi:hypothetical protein K505DRAFT_228919 [Melanomma pulvis-pyrius CBS 109.77]|uniref:Uncharacterized protein n=1 Tax=Melanomma pulvis-pyrius CBS 109.77 TaxID=1314802 RepID=A0A6A6XVC0_9PLEO|nr:hypothetical protein K505DRAFT_228919 [Melanomma pulvis-pyrius CBS 109.77]